MGRVGKQNRGRAWPRRDIVGHRLWLAWLWLAVFEAAGAVLAIACPALAHAGLLTTTQVLWWTSTVVVWVFAGLGMSVASTAVWSCPRP